MLVNYLSSFLTFNNKQAWKYSFHYYLLPHVATLILSNFHLYLLICFWKFMVVISLKNFISIFYCFWKPCEIENLFFKELFETFRVCLNYVLIMFHVSKMFLENKTPSKLSWNNSCEKEDWNEYRVECFNEY